ncbi:MAG: methylamine dehydrogenase (amicyanin) light chain [Thiohalocapsa sp.]|jgi:methylamine dehydrogenase light chain|uniref:methylamine dehydrogenase light chain n=1 Tax=Thiohalocapsa sp. TaxID=2497641 RepID=UPI0025DFF1A2|nr:methylamine dehydrogenase light chain [Thiohalocapsa sp.]MCG6942948.1 methylamine dehydrogenase (amicyanin) light chain [Thiohalocapsa sp.]
MKRLLEDYLLRLDHGTERMARHLAQNSGRRSFLGKIGALLAGGALLPMLPFDRSSGLAWGQEPADDADAATDDVHSCDYWRYCAISGTLCSDCGGAVSECPPGSEVSKVLWVGTCHNPSDGKDYLVAYNDCCGKADCYGTGCENNVRERPGYRMALHNEVNWCMANTSEGYHCTIAVLVALADG